LKQDIPRTLKKLHDKWFALLMLWQLLSYACYAVLNVYGCLVKWGLYFMWQLFLLPSATQLHMWVHYVHRINKQEVATASCHIR
jgi:hypothetical protein